MSIPVLLILIFMGVPVRASLGEIQSRCPIVSNAAPYFSADLENILQNPVNLLFVQPRLKKGSKFNPTKATVPQVKIAGVTQYPDTSEKSENSRYVSVKRIEVHLENPLHQDHIREILTELDVLSPPPTGQPANMLINRFGCYHFLSADRRLVVYLVLQEITESMAADAGSPLPKKLVAFRNSPKDVRLRFYWAIANQMFAVHESGHFLNELPADHIFTQELNLKDANSQVRDLSAFSTIFWDEKYQTPVIVDFRKASPKKNPKFTPSKPIICDHETASSGKGSLANDIWVLGRLIAELEFGPEFVNLSPQEVKSDSFMDTFRSDQKRYQMAQRDKIISQAVHSGWSLSPTERYSFADLLQAMLRIDQSDRIQNLGTVMKWLELLAESVSPKYKDAEALANLKAAIEAHKILKQVPSFKKLLVKK